MSRYTLRWWMHLRVLWIHNAPPPFLASRAEPGYNDIGLSNTSPITSQILWFRLTDHCSPYQYTPRLEQRSFITTQNIQSLSRLHNSWNLNPSLTDKTTETSRCCDYHSHDEGCGFVSRSRHFLPWNSYCRLHLPSYVKCWRVLKVRYDGFFSLNFVSLINGHPHLCYLYHSFNRCPLLSEEPNKLLHCSGHFDVGALESTNKMEYIYIVQQDTQCGLNE